MSVKYRLATPEDNGDILRFTSRHAMSAGLGIRFDRSPDFFALLDAHAENHETWLMTERGRIRALASLVVRPGYIHGAIEPVVYLSDLRVEPSRGIAGQWRARFLNRMQTLATETGARYAYCAIIRDNRLARSSIAEHPEFGFRHLAGYATVSLLARKPWRRRPARKVRRATAADLDALAGLLRTDASRRPFGIAFDRAELERRIRLWPGLDVSSFVVVQDTQGGLAGCLAAWDYSGLKRIVIDAMPRATDRLRRLHNALSPLTGRARIEAPPGAVVRDIAITHVAVRDDDPAVFAALLQGACRRAFGSRRTATVSLCVYDGDPFETALRDYWHSRVAMDLYVLRIDPDAPELVCPEPCRPGFEFYLV